MGTQSLPSPLPSDHLVRPLLDLSCREKEAQQQERSSHQENATGEENQGSEAERKNRFLTAFTILIRESL